MRVPLVKEHGAWFVFIFSSAAGMLAGILFQRQAPGSETCISLFLTFAGIASLINSKAPFVSLLRQGTERIWFAFFSLGGLLLLAQFIFRGGEAFIIFLPAVAIYPVLLSQNREHLLFTELLGFSLLTIPAPVMYFVLTGALSLKLYAVVFIFFGAGVFKVRVRTRKTRLFRWSMVLYCLGAFLLYILMDVSTLLLLPLLDNILYSIHPRDEKLKVTGQTELVKGLVFIILFGIFF